MNDETNWNTAGSDNIRAIECVEMERLGVFYACDELSAAERAAVELHAANCARCAETIKREKAIQVLLAHPVERQEPSEILLAQCRSELAESLDDVTEKQSHASWFDAFRPARWLVQSFVGHPAWSAALLVLLGVALGTIVPPYLRTMGAGNDSKPQLTVSDKRQLSEEDLQKVRVAGVNWTTDSGSGTPGVELHMTSEKPYVMAGTADDTDVKRVLTFVVMNGQRFDPGVRLDSLDVLRTRTQDADVRKALCTAANKDANPGVRLKALEALRGVEQDELVRRTLVNALMHDDNPGVRVEAINLLQAGVRPMGDQPATLGDQELLRVLRECMERDPSNYVRMQSAAAIRELGPRRQF
jgi:hypothetical protein